MSQQFIEELKRFAIHESHKHMIEVINDKETLKDDEEYIYQVFVTCYQAPAVTPRETLKEFFSKLSFKRLLKSPQEAGKLARYAGLLTPNFNPSGGWESFSKFIEELVSKVQSYNNSLKEYLRSFKDVSELYEEIKNFYGVGPNKALQIIRELRYAGLINVDISKLGIPPADPIKRVLTRTGLIPNAHSLRSDQIDEELRKIFKDSSLLVIDFALWTIGFHYCKEKPMCDICPIAFQFPKQCTI